MVELGFGGGSNPTPPTQTHIPTDPTLPYPIYTPLPLPAPNLPYLSLPYQTPPHAKPPTPSTNYLYLCPTLPCSARHWVKHGMEFYHEFFKGTFSIYLQPHPPHTINPTDHLTPTPPTLTLIPLTMTPPPDIDPRL